MSLRHGFVGSPHPSHPFTTPHPTVYENSRRSGKKLPTDELTVDESQCLQDEGVDCSSSCMRAFVWDLEGSHSSQWSSRREGRGRGSNPPIGDIISYVSHVNEELSSKHFILDS
jgi:hypothetical protein